MSVNQGGFRKGHSTIDTIAKFTDRIMAQINNTELTHAVFVDFKKAFDTVDHLILLKKMANLGIKNQTLNIFRNYLSNRTQRTLANGIVSEDKPILCGVPQGSILGPLLFLIYVNDLEKCTRTSFIKLYADDSDCSSQYG